MVQVLPARPSFGERFSQAFQPAFQTGLERFLGEEKERGRLREEDEALRRFGVETGGIRAPGIRQKLIEGELKKKQLAQEYDFDEKSYETIKNAFGDRFADVWKASPTGARTELTRAAIEATKRGQNVRELFEQIPEDRVEDTQRISPEKGKDKFPEYKLPRDNRTEAEMVKYKKELRAYNTPILSEAIKTNKILDTQLNAVKDLEKLNAGGKLPTGLSRIFVDPKSGNIRPLAQMLQLVPPEAEQYVKIINDFTTQAKDSFGARVTNFELDRFMKRLPILSNSEEGRRLILQRMRVNAQADKLYQKALKDVYRHYGADNITPEDAEAIAEEQTSAEIENLRDQGVELDEEMDQLTGEGGARQPELPPGTVLMLDPQGNPLYVPESEVENLVRLGAQLAS